MKTTCCELNLTHGVTKGGMPILAGKHSYRLHITFVQRISVSRSYLQYRVCVLMTEILILEFRLVNDNEMNINGHKYA